MKNPKPFKFPEPSVFELGQDEKISLLIPANMARGLDSLYVALKMDDRSKVIRWILNEALKDAVKQGVISGPTVS